MASRSEPWIFTDDKLPCLIVEGKIIGKFDLNRMLCELNGNFKYVSNIYNCSSFIIDTDYELVFCINSLEKIAFVLFNASFAEDIDGALQKISQIFSQSITKVQRVISHSEGECFQLRNIKIEMTGKTSA